MTRTPLLCLTGALLAPLPSLADSAPRQTVEVTAAKPALPDAATLGAMTGAFALSDGRTLRVMHPGLHLMVAIDKGWARTVEPIGENRFASRDGRLVVRFDPGLDTLHVIEDQRVAVAARSGTPALR